MVDANRNDDPGLLAEALLREAAEDRPQFSQSLHARLCDAVRQARAPSSPSHLSHSSHFSHLSLAVAAAIVLLVVSAIAWLRPHEGSNDSQIAEEASTLAKPADPAIDLDKATALAGETIDGLDDLVDQALASQQWGGLEDDAREVLEALVDQLPADLSSALALSGPSDAINP